jgi:soluble lytic murein transglycosylase
LRRRVALIALAAVLGAVAAFLVSRIGVVDDVLKQVTLPLSHEDIIRQQAAEKDLDPSLVAAVIYAETRFNPRESKAGAMGLMQVTPETAERIARLSGGTQFVVSDLDNPQINISYGCYWLRHLLDRYGGNEVAALAAYNAGEANADAWGGSDMAVGDIRFPETRAYVEEVLEKRGEYRSKYASELGL